MAETELTIAFLDRSPLFRGHTLVAPRVHLETLRDLPDDLLAPFFAEVRRVTVAVQDASGPTARSCPEQRGESRACPTSTCTWCPAGARTGCAGFFWPRERYADADESAAFATRIRSALAPP